MNQTCEITVTQFLTFKLGQDAIALNILQGQEIRTCQLPS
jgi:chemotaxis signal transduction protein